MIPGRLKIERGFIMKGASNKYGNTKGSGGQGKPSTHINYQWAKYFNKIPWIRILTSMGKVYFFI